MTVNNTADFSRLHLEVAPGIEEEARLRTSAVYGPIPESLPGAILSFLKKNNVILPLGAWLPVGEGPEFCSIWDVFGGLQISVGYGVTDGGCALESQGCAKVTDR